MGRILKNDLLIIASMLLFWTSVISCLIFNNEYVTYTAAIQDHVRQAKITESMVKNDLIGNGLYVTELVQYKNK